MPRRFDDDDDERPGWFWRFLKGVVVSVVVCGMAIAVVSLYVLPPAERPLPEPEVAAPPAGPKMIAGIEVSDQPAYSATPASARAPETFEPISLPGPAISVNAAPFEADPETPLVAVVLDDAAADPLLHSLIFALELPLTVGVVAGRDGDRVTAQAAWDAGFEVVAELPLAQPGSGTPTGLEYGLEEAEAASRAELLMRRLPMAVAAARPLASVAPPNREVLRGIATALAPHGFGYLDHGVALLDASIAAEMELGVPVGASRFSVPAGTELSEVMEILDAAAEDAAIRGAAVVLATPSEDVIGALQLWAGSGPARLAPLSAALARLSGG